MLNGIFNAISSEKGFTFGWIVAVGNSRVCNVITREAKSHWEPGNLPTMMHMALLFGDTSTNRYIWSKFRAANDQKTG